MEGLYDDLHQPALVSEEEERLQLRVAALSQEAATLQGALTQVSGRAAASEESVHILERNMSALYNTARMELACKDEEIKALRAA